MIKLKPWYKVATPREDLREGRPLDAAEFAVHLDQVRDGSANEDYRLPERFFDRTFLTKSLLELAGETVRRLSGKKTETSAVFNMATQFGGGKTHALTLLYHLATQGPKASKWTGVSRILAKAGVQEVPKAATAVFVGNEFDSLHGRGGDDGTPKRMTPWGEIAFQLSGEAGFQVVAEHEQQMTAPSGEVIRKFLPKDKPCLILIDELMNYISRNRKSGLATQFYNFIQSLTEVARGSTGVVLVVSVPASDMELSGEAEDQADHQRYKNLLDRVGKAIIMSAESETSEIIRRRLFEWDPRAITSDGKILLTKDAVDVCAEYANWMNENRTQFPNWFSIDHARSAFEATYPFHPMVLSVFERKWQELPRFQRTRGILRLLALWVSHTYQKGFKGAQGDLLIELGTAPLDDPQFRSAVFEQLGEYRLEGAVTTDICGRKESHATRLDEEAVDTIKKARLHRKVATAIFFESNGGQSKNEATAPEVRLATAGPDMDLGNVETTLVALTDACYYLTVEGSRYQLSLKENLNKRFADRRASVRDEDMESRIREEIQKAFPKSEGIETPIFFPENSSHIPDRPVLTIIVMAPDASIANEPEIQKKIDAMTKEYGKSSRTYKSALLWIVPDSAAALREDARKLLAWEHIRDEGLKLDEIQKKQLDTNVNRSGRDLKEVVWRTYKNVMVLDRDNTIKKIDLGLITSSAAESMTKLVIIQLRQRDEVAKDVVARLLTKNWPPAFTEWSTKAVRDAFFASPQFPRLLNPESIKETIARGVSEGLIAYVGKSPDGGYSPFYYKKSLQADDVEISEDMFILTAEEAEKHIQPPKLTKVLIYPPQTLLKPSTKQTFRAEGLDQFGRGITAGPINWTATGGTIGVDGTFTAGKDEGNFIVTAAANGITGTAGVTVTTEQRPPTPEPEPKGSGTINWIGEVPPQKWTNFYMKVLTKLVASGDVKLTVTVKSTPKDGVTDQQLQEIKAALRGLALDDSVRTGSED